jgi:divinyl protochlorophyllide a 8-vinyl-reductase
MQAGSSGRIGPNAILQLVPVLTARLGIARMRAILDATGLLALPDGQAMIPELQAARLHQTLRHMEPMHASAILREAGERTAHYIMAHRIPKWAQRILRLLPATLAARLLARAITHHAWTFVGSGTFRALSPWIFEITDNPLIEGEEADAPLCIWHAAVFTTLYRALVTPEANCVEVECGAHGAPVCRFEIVRSRQAGDSIPPPAF